jgi:hypothetical protein
VAQIRHIYWEDDVYEEAEESLAPADIAEQEEAYNDDGEVYDNQGEVRDEIGVPC